MGQRWQLLVVIWSAWLLTGALAFRKRSDHRSELSGRRGAKRQSKQAKGEANSWNGTDDKMRRDPSFKNLMKEWDLLRQEASAYDKKGYHDSSGDEKLRGSEDGTALLELAANTSSTTSKRFEGFFFKNVMPTFTPYQTKKGWGPTPDSFVVYPSGSEAKGKKFPIISFLHGLFGSFSTTYLVYKGLLHYVASYGFVVVATTLCPAVCPLNLYSKIQRFMIDMLKTSLYRGMSDFSRTGLMGHSMGGSGTIISSQVSDTSLKAAVAMNPAPTFGNLHTAVLKIFAKMPSFFTGGALDTCMPPPVSWPYFKMSPSGSARVIIAGASHSSSVGSVGQPVGIVVSWIAVFLRCHVAGDNEACQLLQDKMCRSLRWKAVACRIKGEMRSAQL